MSGHLFYNRRSKLQYQDSLGQLGHSSKGPVISRTIKMQHFHVNPAAKIHVTPWRFAQRPVEYHYSLQEKKQKDATDV